MARHPPPTESVLDQFPPAHEIVKTEFRELYSQLRGIVSDIAEGAGEPGPPGAPGAPGTPGPPGSDATMIQANYVTIGNDAGLTNERALTGTVNQVTVTDGGPNSTATLGTPQDIATFSAVEFGKMGLAVVPDTTAKLTIAGQYGSTTIPDGNLGATATIDWDTGNTHLVTLTANCTLTLSNPKDGFRYLIFVAQDATGSRTVTWPGTVQWTVGAAPVLTTTPGAIDVVTLVWLSDISQYIAAANLAGGNVAPKTPSYVVLSLNSTLVNERVLTGTTNQITITDGGSNGNVTLSTPQDLDTAAVMRFARMGLAVAADSSAKLIVSGQYGSTTYSAGNSSTAITLDWDNGNTQLMTLTGNATITLSNPKDGFRYLIFLKQDGTGTRTVTWPSAVKWKAGTAPTLTTTVGAVDLVTLVWVAALGASGNYLAAANLNYTPA